METTKSELSAKNLKSILWETLQEVKEGKMEPGQADSIASTTREILRTTAVQLKIAQQSKRNLPVDVLKFSEE